MAFKINKETKLESSKYKDNSEPATIDNVVEGTLLTYAFSYSARIPKFARVVKRTNSSVKIELLEKQIVDDDGYGQNGTCIANLNGKTEAVNKSFRFKRANGRLYIDNCPAYIYRGYPEDFYTD